MTKHRPMDYLLTPGPLTTSARTKEAMLRDWGSRDADFIALTARVRKRLCALAHAEAAHVCVPIQGSGTFAVEAAIQTLVPRAGKLLVLVNGAYGRRMVDIAKRLPRDCTAITCAEETPVDPAALDRALAGDAAITHVAVVHCETTSGILNPVEDVARVTAEHGRTLLVDAMSAFGALEIDARATPFAALMASSNKCLEGVPGLSFVIAQSDALAAAEGHAASLALDLHAQWRAMEKDGQWRFTPPTHVLAALDAALDQLDEEGGVAARRGRYVRNCRVLVEGMRALGFKPVLAPEVQAPIIVTFDRPEALDFTRFSAALKARGFVIYPGKLMQRDTFRIGCIGAIDETVMAAAVKAVSEAVQEMGFMLPP